MSELVQVGEVVYKLDPPWTADEVKASIRRAKTEPMGWRCRHDHHKYKRIGRVHFPKEDLLASVLSMAASRDVRGLARCERCGSVAKELGP